MPKAYLPTSGPDDWQQLLADPVKHWKTGYSAKALAYCWEAATAFPAEVASALAAADWTEQEHLIAIPEYEVALPGGKRASYNDLFVLAKLDGKLAVIMVEGKVNEPFGPTLAEWGPDSSPGKSERLAFLKKVLLLPDTIPGTLRYQLLHRLASPILTAQKFNADIAILLVHSFSQQAAHFSDFAQFMQLYDVQAQLGQIHTIKAFQQPEVYCGWVTGHLEFLER